MPVAESIDTPEPLAENPPGAAPRWAAMLPWATGLVAVLAFLGVFVVPWLVPMRVYDVLSPSQEYGYNNSVAYIAMMLAALAVVALGVAWRRANPDRTSAMRPVVLDEPAADADALNRWLLAALMLALVGMVAYVGHLDGPYSNGDGSYFIDRMLRLAAGGRLGVDFEFAYGPLSIFVPYGFWLALRPLGLSIYQAYYACVAMCQVLGLAAAAYLLNRLRLTRNLRVVGLLIVFCFSITRIELGLNTVPIRFLAPFVAVVWVLAVARRNVWAACGAALLGSAIVWGISPEMGAAATVGMVAGLGLQISRDALAFAVPTAVAGLAGVGCFAGFLLSGLSSMSSYLIGGAMLPMLPGQAGVMFAVTVLLLGLGTGLTVRRDEWRLRAAQIGFLLCALVLAKAAMGRADSGHLFLNGLGAILLALALADQIAHAFGVAYGAAVSVVFLVTAVSANAVFASSVYVSGVNHGVISKYSSAQLATDLGRTQETGREWYRDALALAAEPTPADVQMLIASKSVATPYMLYGKVAVTLAENHALLPVYAIPVLSLSPAQTQPTLDSLARARYVLLPTGDYNVLLSAAKSRPADSSPTWIRRPTAVSDVTFYSSQCGFPLRTHPVNPVYEPLAVLGQYLKRDWVLDHYSGGYVILVRR